jgi:sulfite exporter TauE/SafE
MLVAFLLGLMGSLGHCVGMCSGIALLLSRQGVASGWRLLPVHLGRITTYGLLGLVAGALGHTALLILGLPGKGTAAGAGPPGHTMGSALPGLSQLQGGLAVVVAGMAGYFALALLGRVPSPEVYLVNLTSRWGRMMRRFTTQKTGGGVLASFLLGLVWGLLPCGLVLTALLAAAVTSSPWYGSLTMLAFGLGTWPALVGAGWVVRRGIPRVDGRRWEGWPRHVAALVVLLFGTQMALRGLAAWGWVAHLHLGSVMIW